jgi:signal transduction histidine kinase
MGHGDDPRQQHPRQHHLMADPAVAIERRRRDPAFLAALGALGLGVLALAFASHGLLADTGMFERSSWAYVGGPLAAAGALALAGLVLRSRLRATRRSHQRELFFAACMARLQGPLGFALTLGTLLQDLRAFFHASGVAVPVRDAVTGRAVLWAVPAGAAPGTRAHAVELGPAASDWLFETGADYWAAERSGTAWRLVAIDDVGRLVVDPEVPLDALDRLAGRLGAHALLAVGFGRGRDWAGRVVLSDPRPEGPRKEALAFARRLMRELGGVVQARFLLGRLRTRIGAMERARVARELHDGTIQALVGVEMEVDVLRRRAEQQKLPLAADLTRVQGLLRGEVLDLRDTMQRLKATEIAPEQLVGFLDAAVARFGRDTGVHAVFDCSVEDVDLPAGVCREVVRIAQEALQNVRKHSGARNVMVRFGRARAGWRLAVDDDGQGFPFEGTLTHAELDQGRTGPYVIKERVRALGGELTIVSSPGSGARLEILVPREAR